AVASDSPDQERLAGLTARSVVRQEQHMALPKSVMIYEEGPREGFQIEKQPIATDAKVQLIDALSDTGVKHLQVGSFVDPRRVPSMADVDSIVQRMKVV